MRDSIRQYATSQCRDRILVSGSNVSFTYPSADKKLYYNGGLSLNKSIDPTSIGL